MDTAKSGPNFSDLYETPTGRSVLAVRLGTVNSEDAMRGAPILNVQTPEWVEEAAKKERIMLSVQPDSKLAHFWVETPAGGQVCRPNEWVLNVFGSLYVMDNSLFRHFFPAVQLEVSNEH